MKNVAIWMSFSPLLVVETDQFSVTDTIIGGTTISAVTTKLYLGNTDKSALLTTGASYSGNSYTTAKIVGVVGGNIYVLSSRVTIDGEVKTRKCEIRVQKESELS
jgi:hypothetical protein